METKPNPHCSQCGPGVWHLHLLSQPDGTIKCTYCDSIYVNPQVFKRKGTARSLPRRGRRMITNVQ